MIFHFLLLRTDQQKVHDCENQNKRHKLCDGFHENRPFSGCNTGGLQILAEPMACKRPAQDTKGRIWRKIGSIVLQLWYGQHAEPCFDSNCQGLAKEKLALPGPCCQSPHMKLGLLFKWIGSLTGVLLVCGQLATIAGAEQPAAANKDPTQEPMPVLDVSVRKEWVAVGAVTGAAGPVVPACSGLLVAPDLVLTAAHCVGGGANRNTNRSFVAGWDSPRLVMRVRSAEVKVHPDYESAPKDVRFRYDVATIRLERPVPSHLVKPIAIRPYSDLLSGPFAIVGYHRSRPSAVNGRFDCERVDPPAVPILHLDCFVISGNSGAPTLIQEDGEWKSVAVLVATFGTDGAVAVPHDTWVLLEWTAALERAKIWK
jgi:V8-like Glu-specific endopeptidase